MIQLKEGLEKIKQVAATLQSFVIQKLRAVPIRDFSRVRSSLQTALEQLRVQAFQFYSKHKSRGGLSSSRVSRRGLQFGFLLGTIGTLVAFGALVFFGYRAESVSLRVAQDSLNSNSRVLGSHFKYKLEGYREIIRMFVDLQVSSLIKNGETFIASPLEIIPEIADISLWAARSPESALEVGPQFTRARLFVNFKFPQMSSEFYQKILDSEIQEKKIIQSLSSTKEFLQLSPLQYLPQKKLAMLILKIPHPEFQLIAVAHIDLSALYAALRGSGLAFAAFVDEHGKSILDSNQSTENLSFSPQLGISPMLHAMNASRKERDAIEFKDDLGHEFIGSFERLGVGQSAVLSLLSLETITSGFNVLTWRSLFLLSFAFLLFFAYGYSLFSRSTQFPPELSQEEERRLLPQKVNATVLHGSLRQLFYLLEIESPEQARDTLNEFFTLAAQLIRQSGGMFERVSGRSFMGVWGVPDAAPHAAELAVNIALELRKAYFRLDEARKVDGQKPFSYTLAVHEGEVLAAQMGPSGELHYSVAGDVIQQVAALEGVALNQKKDLLISDAIRQQVSGQVQSRVCGEGKLSAASGLVSFYEVLGYSGEQGQFIEVPVHPNAIQDSSSVGALLETEGVEMVAQPKKDLRWIVNNGNQIIGPFRPDEIAKLLFTQELDFDSECWEETSGRSSQIKTSGIFSGGSEDQDAQLWMYDDQTIHGPVSLGFIQTAIQHAAISDAVWICDSSTANGWKKVPEFLASQAREGSSAPHVIASSTEHLEQDAEQDSLKKAA